MKTLSDFVTSAAADKHVWISDVRKAFSEDASSKKAVIRLEKLDGLLLDYSCPVSRWKTEAEYIFLLDYLSARIFNLLSVYSAKSITVFCDEELKELVEQVFPRFQTEDGYRKVINIARRLNGCEPFTEILPLSEYVPVSETAEETKADISARVLSAVEKVKNGSYCGIDVGGTDIKLAASLNGKLVAVKEYDWNPSLFRRAEEIKAPVRLLAELMAACVENERLGKAVDMAPALDKDASHETMENCIRAVKEKSGGLKKFDGLALSFPDIVIHDRILGGETPKTAGIRADTSVDYEAELLSLSRLNDELLTFSEKVSAINDGPMATFSALTELTVSDSSRAGAVLAHSLGTDLGTGWIDGSGEVPPIPMECYDLLFDLGSSASKALPPEDMRSLKNENSGMAGARRYLGQAGVYRLVYLDDPEIIRDFIDESKGFPEIKMFPEDMRKPCLAYIMQRASEGDKVCEAAFRQVGVNLAEITEEIAYITRVKIDARWLFGRFVKEKHCFEEICEGFTAVIPDIKLIAADDDIAATPLMKELAERPGVTVAQFAQAVSALYFCEY